MNRIEKAFLAIGILVLIGAVVYFFLPEQKVTEQSPVKIGIMVPLSGESSTFGFPIQKGILLAKKDLAAHNVELIIEDSGCDKKMVEIAMNKFVAEKVSAVIGEVCSGASLAALPIAEKNHIVLMSPASTNPTLSGSSPYFFRTVPSDSLQGVFASKVLVDRSIKKVALIYSDEPYGVGLTKVVKDEFEKSGGSVVIEMPIKSNKIDLKTEIDLVKKSDPDAIFILSNSPSVSIVAVKEIKAAGIKATLFGSEALKTDTILNEIRDVAEGMILTSVALGSNDFMRAYKLEYGVDPISYVAQAYDAFHVLNMTILQGAHTGDEIKDLLPTITLEGVSGKIHFDAKGDIGGGYELTEIKDGQFVTITR